LHYEREALKYNALRKDIALLIVALLLFAADVCRGQDSSASATRLPHESLQTTAPLDSSGDESIKWYTMLTRIPGDWVRCSNITFRSENIPAFLGMTVLTGALIATDGETWKASDRWYNSSRFVASVSDQFEQVGDGMPQFELSAAFAAYGLIWNDKRSVKTGSEIVEAILACGIVVQTLKHITGRESPFVSTRSNGRWDFFPNQITYHKRVPHYDAYPSGHIATTIATVTVITENYPEWKWVKPIGYVITGLVGVGMGNTGIHWYSDYPLGIAIGYMFGMIAAHPEGLPSEKAREPQKFTVGPMLSPYGAGIGVMMKF